MLAAMTAAVIAIGVPSFRRVRKVVAAARALADGAQPGASPFGGDLSALLAAPVSLLVAAVGIAGLVIMLWLMVLKPF